MKLPHQRVPERVIHISGLSSVAGRRVSVMDIYYVLPCTDLMLGFPVFSMYIYYDVSLLLYSEYISSNLLCKHENRKPSGLSLAVIQGTLSGEESTQQTWGDESDLPKIVRGSALLGRTSRGLCPGRSCGRPPCTITRVLPQDHFLVPVGFVAGVLIE